jgi:AcrR family transcriptional regulator
MDTDEPVNSILHGPAANSGECVDDRGAGVAAPADALNRAPVRVHWQSVDQKKDDSLEHSRTPKQTRSRQSFDRVIDAATHLLAKKGFTGLTLTQVSKLSRVSIGSIYCRVDSKEHLVRAVQARALKEMDHEFAMLVNRVRRKSLPLRALVPTMIRELALYLRRHAPLLRAFMQQATHDPVVEAVGKKSFQQNALDFKLILLERHVEFRHPDPEHAAAMCFTVVYGSLARYLGLGAPEEDEGEWNRLIEDLGLMALGFLVVDLKHVMLTGKAPK